MQEPSPRKFGYPAVAAQLAAEAVKFSPNSPAVEPEAALAFSMAGDKSHAESLAQDMATRFPVNTQINSFWLPPIRAQLALGDRNSTLALNDLQATTSNELGMIPFVMNLSCLYPTYVRGEAYLTAGQGTAAAGEFQKIIDHSGLVWNCWTGALAHLGVVRANALKPQLRKGPMPTPPAFAPWPPIKISCRFGKPPTPGYSAFQASQSGVCEVAVIPSKVASRTPESYLAETWAS